MKPLHEWATSAALLVWPPYGLRFGEPTAPDQPLPSPSAELRAKSWPAISPEVQQAHLAAAESIYRAEQERKKTIEDKGSSFFAGATMSSSLVLAIPTLLVGKVDAPIGTLLLIAAPFAVAASYLLGAAYYATRVRAGGQAHVVNATSLDLMRVGDSDFRRVWALSLVDMTRRNAPFLTRKTNYLYVAEQMFLRGVLVALLAGLVLAVAAILRPIPVGARSAVDTALAACMQSNLGLGADLVNAARVNGELRAAAELAIKQEVSATAKLQARVNSRKSSGGACCNPAPAQGICQSPPGESKSREQQVSPP